MFRGVYRDFDEAIAAAPKTKPIGYDHPEPAALYSKNYRIINPSDYPILFWLRCRLPECATIFDLGGNVGISFYSYQPYLSYSPVLNWIVYDVPAVTRQGEAIALKEVARGLSFSNNMQDAENVDILLANGSLQYLEKPFSESLAALRKKPAHLLINKVPLRDGLPFVTLQTLGSAFCPYRIFNREAFIHSICATGYELIDAWQNADLSCNIPLRPEYSVSAYSGLYFKRKTSA